MPLKLHPYNPDKDLKTAVVNARWKIISEHNARAMAEPMPSAEEIELRRARREWRREWYYKRGGKAIAKKNGQDRRAKLKREGKL